MNSFWLKGIDSRLVSKIMNTKYVFEEDIEYLAKIEEFHGEENTLTYATNQEYTQKAVEIGYKFIFVKPENVLEVKGVNFLETDNPRESFVKLVNYLNSNKHYESIESSNGKNTKFGKNVEISENVQIGNNVEIGNNVVIYENVIIEDNVKIGNFCVLGSKGYDVSLLEGELVHSGVHGGLYIGKNCIIRNFVNIDSSVWGQNTTISQNVSIDSNVLIGHDVNLSENVSVRGGSVISGFSKIGKNTTIGVKTVITQRSEIGENCLTTAGSIISKKYPDNSKIISLAPKVQKL